MDKQLIKKIKEHFGTGINPGYLAKTLGLPEKAVLDIWYPTGNISLSFKDIENRNPELNMICPNKDYQEATVLMLDGYSNSEIALKNQMTRATVKNCYDLLPKRYQAAIQEARLIRKIKYLREITEYYLEHGAQATANRFAVTVAVIRNRLKEARKRGILND